MKHSLQANQKPAKTIFSPSIKTIPKLITFNKLSYQKETKSTPEDPTEITFVCPISSRIISENEYKEINQGIAYNKKNIPKKRTSAELRHSLQGAGSHLGISKPYNNWSTERLDQEIEKLKKEISQKEKENKENTEEKIENYEKIIKKWKKIAQDAIYLLIEEYPQDSQFNDNTVATVIKAFNIDKELIDYDSGTECFKE